MKMKKIDNLKQKLLWGFLFGEEKLAKKIFFLSHVFPRLKVAQLRATGINVSLKALVRTKSRWTFSCSLGWGRRISKHTFILPLLRFLYTYTFSRLLVLKMKIFLPKPSHRHFGRCDMMKLQHFPPDIETAFDRFRRSLLGRWNWWFIGQRSNKFSPDTRKQKKTFLQKSSLTTTFHSICEIKCERFLVCLIRQSRRSFFLGNDKRNFDVISHFWANRKIFTCPVTSWKFFETKMNAHHSLFSARQGTFTVLSVQRSNTIFINDKTLNTRSVVRRESHKRKKRFNVSVEITLGERKWCESCDAGCEVSRLVISDDILAKSSFADAEDEQINENSNNVLEGIASLPSTLSIPLLVCLFFIRFSQKQRRVFFLFFHFK